MRKTDIVGARVRQPSVSAPQQGDLRFHFKRSLFAPGSEGAWRNGFVPRASLSRQLWNVWTHTGHTRAQDRMEVDSWVFDRTNQGEAFISWFILVIPFLHGNQVIVFRTHPRPRNRLQTSTVTLNHRKPNNVPFI